LSGGAGGRAGARRDLYRAHAAGRHSQRTARSKTEDRVSTPLAVQAAPPVGGSRVGKAGFVIGIAIVAVVAIGAVFGNALVALAVVGLLGSGLGLVVATLGLLLWDRFAVVARATTMQVRTLDYVSAAWCAGASTAHILTKEILPNIASHLAVVATLEMALAILLEAALSFLGLGVPPPLPSWGLMIAEGKDYMFFSPWVIMIPGIALFTLVLGINLVGDGLRNLLGTERLR